MIGPQRTEHLYRTAASLAFFLAWVALAALPPGADAAEPRKFGLVIAISDYADPKLAQLPGARNDAELIASLLRARFGFSSDDVTLLLDNAATHTGIVKALAALADNVSRGDIVYIHYSGHGSQSCDLTGTEESGKNSTLVPFGARAHADKKSSAYDCGMLRETIPSPQPKAQEASLDDFDVLDKEINQLLARIAAKTSNVIFVADSCHSGSITRDATAYATRGVAMDMRPNPAGSVARVRNPTWVAVSACNVEEKAREFSPGQGDDRTYGLFTWAWAEALQESAPGDTWYDLCRRASLRMIRLSASYQRPQFEGDRSRLVFGGRLGELPRTVAVSSVRQDGVTIQAGSLLGVNQGAVFRKYDPASPKEKLPTLRITQAQPTYARGTAEGSFAVGDLVVLESYAPAVAPLRVLVRADLATDEGKAQEVRAMLKAMPAFQLADDIRRSDMVLQILRPSSGPQKGAGQSAVPPSSPGAQPQCWILDSSEALYNGQEELKIPLSGQGMAHLRDNLQKLAKARNLLSLSSARLASTALDVRLLVHDLAPEVPEHAPLPEGCVAPDGDSQRRVWRYGRTLSREETATYRFQKGQLLLFELRNDSPTDYYIYLVAIAPNGAVQVYYPVRELGAGAGLVRAGTSRTLDEVAILLNESREYVRLIASRSPIDIFVLEQDAYAARAMAAANPLDSLLLQSAGATRSAPLGSVGAADWMTELIAIETADRPLQ